MRRYTLALRPMLVIQSRIVPDEINQLVRVAEAGASLEAVAERLQRSPGAVR